MSARLVLESHIPSAALRGIDRVVYAGDDPSFEIHGIERVEIAEVKAAKAAQLRDPYLDVIGGLSIANESLEWWSSHLAAKQPYPSLFGRLCGLAAALELAADRTLIVCSTPAQLAELRITLGADGAAGERLGKLRWGAHRAVLGTGWPLLRAAATHLPDRVTGRLAAPGNRATFALERVPEHRRRVLDALGARRLGAFAGSGTALLVTWLDKRSFAGDGSFTDPHLGPLGAMLRERGLRVATIVKPLLHAPFASCARRLLASGEPAVFPDVYLEPQDWRECERRIASWDAEVSPDLDVGGVPFARLAREYLAEHRRAQVDALIHERLLARLAEDAATPEVIVFPWEGHAWEHALIEGVRRHMPGTSIVGYDNLNFSRLALSLYPSARELGIRPLPDRVVTNGETFAGILRASAFPDERIRVGCALRHPMLSDPARRTRREERFVLAACSIDNAQSIELLRKAAAAFGEELVVRLHPASDAAAIRTAMPALRFADEPLGELLPRARLMLYTYSVVPYEALATGTPPVFVRSETMLDLDQLEPTPDVRWVARTPDELRAVAREIDAMPDRERWERRAREVVRAAFNPVGGGCVERFLV